ncbi:hypothetical protein OQA88_6636 [Cercophora sp. LCS_1]
MATSIVPAMLGGLRNSALETAHSGHNDRAQPADDDIFASLNLRGGRGSRGLGDDSDEDNKDDILPSRQRPGQRRRETAQRPGRASRHEFQPGAIVRVKVENFVTYEKAEFFLGPNLNMVIGPNGTGKSSLVCAICLGLGYPSSVLGRASAFGDFVKHGRDEAKIEIELQRKPEHELNYVVGLRIGREDNGRTFYLNGKAATHKVIKNLMTSLRIQIDNLCQFLPQDKVAEFAGLTPVELLTETLRAAAPPVMIEWQDKLKEHFKEQVEAEQNAERSREDLKVLETRQRALQADVEKIRERQAIQREIEKLEAMHVVVRYRESHDAFREAKNRKKEAERKLRRLERSSAPSLQAVTSKEEYLAQVEVVAAAKKAVLHAAEAAADDALKSIESVTSKAQEIDSQIKAEIESFNRKKTEISNCRRKITSLQAEHNQAPPPFDAGEWNRKIREKEHLIREHDQTIAEVNTKAVEYQTDGRKKQQEMKELEANLEQLESQQGQRLNHLRRLSPDAATGWEWLQENQDKFEKEVFGPPMLTCTVKDPQYNDLVQSMMRFPDFLCFTAQSINDHTKLSDYFYKELKLSVTIRTATRPFSSFQSPMPKELLARLGFEGYAIDYVDAPEPVLAMLCAESKLHTSPIARAQPSEAQLDQAMQTDAISQFAAGSTTYRVTRRREYGPGAVTTTILKMRQAQFWKDDAVDASEKDEILEKIAAVREEVKDFVRLFKEEVQRMKDLETEKKKMQEELAERQSLAQNEQELKATRRRANEHEARRDRAVVDKANAVLAHQERVGAIRDAWQEYLVVQLLVIEANSDVTYLRDRNSAIRNQLEAEKQVLEALKQEVDERKRQTRVLLGEIAEVVGEEGREQLIAELGDKSAEDINTLLNAEKNKLEVIQANNPLALEEYERWATKVEQTQATFARQEQKLAELNEKIQTVRNQFEPELDKLVSDINDAFSYNFEQISCAGEVEVGKDEDFFKWTIEIKVKFRENETLQRLDQHRQSGGERAVSTIFYLMSLQAMAQAPFRVVDEINQGMDPRNERMVHERMVEIACREHTSQYFLITPKLLSGLKYDERMKVHTIVSGENVDKNGTKKMNLANFANIQRRLKAS